MKYFLCGGCLLLFAVLIDIAQPTCVLESDFGFKINCAFKKAGLFRVRNLGGVKAHASIGFSLGDELGFEQSLSNQDPSRRRSVNVRNGVPVNSFVDTSNRTGKQEKRGKQNRIMMRPMAPATRPNQAAMDKLSTLHRRISTMQPIIVGPTIESPKILTPVNIPMNPASNQGSPSVTLAKPMAMGVPPFKPLPPKEETLKVVPLASTTKKIYTPLQIPQSKGPGMAYQSENYPHASHDQVSKMVSQMTAIHVAQPPLFRITPTPIFIDTSKLYSVPTTVNPFVPMPVAAPPTQGFSIVPAPIFTETQQPLAPKPTQFVFQNPNPNFVDPVPNQIHDLASQYAYNTKKIDDYNSITGYNDDTILKVNKEDINSKIVEIAKAGNISMEAVEAAIALRQQQLLTKYANLGVPSSSTSTTTTTTTTEEPLGFQPEPEPEIVVVPAPSKPKNRNPTAGKVMNAPREYYPVGYEKNFDDHFQSKVDLPDTNFHCGDQKYFPGLYGDENLGCMVFHVCALTDDGLVMKSFLCPESTLFDQTILKCNWWFYVDCKNTRKLYETNIPVSKSYQLMKALTFFSSYKKEMQDPAAVNPEDDTGIKEAITILENQDNRPSQTYNEPNAIHVITPQPFLDERNNHKVENITSPVYRGTRNYNVTKLSARRTTLKPKTQESFENSDVKLITLNAGLNFKDGNTNSNENSSKRSVENSSKSNSAETSTERRASTTEKRHRRRMTLKNSTGPQSTQSTTVKYTTTITTTVPTSTLKPVETSTFNTLLHLIRQEIQPMNLNPANKTEEKQEKLTDQIADLSEIDHSILKDAEKLPPNKRFYRSSAEISHKLKDFGEMTIVNNEKVQVIRPTSSARLVGEYQTPTATIARLDEAILGKSNNQRFKKSVRSIVAANQKPRNIESERT